ncbi:MAG: hypothetical protein R3F58_10870 [Steroidobacteraceae bacterium]
MNADSLKIRRTDRRPFNCLGWAGMAAGSLVAGLAVSQADGAYSIERKLQFIAGDANMRTGLARQPAVRDLVAGEFSISVVDLDDDGKQEVIVVGSGSAYCGSGGCLTVVLRNTAAAQLEPIFEQNLFPELGVTREKVNGYRLLAALDSRGGVARGERPGTPMFGRPLVYPMSAASTAQPSPSQAPAAQAAGGPRQTSAGGGIDVLGIRPGKSKIADVRKALAAVQPTLTLVDGQMSLAGRSASAGGTEGPVEVGDGPFLRQIEAYTGTPNTSRRCNVGPQATCEKITVSFSGPPSAGTAQIVLREVTFGGGGPTFENMLSSLTSKYGAAGLQQAFGDGGRSRHLTWAWDGAGRPVALNERHTCANARGAIYGVFTIQEEMKRATVHLEAGCVTSLKAEFGGLNGIVSNLKIVAVDHQAVRDLHTLTSRYVDEQVAAKERQQRDKAGAVAAPTL